MGRKVDLKPLFSFIYMYLHDIYYYDVIYIVYMYLHDIYYYDVIYIVENEYIRNRYKEKTSYYINIQ